MMQLKTLKSKKPQLGISIYPNKATFEQIIEYVKLANKHGFNRVFTNLIGLTKDELDLFVNVCKETKALGMTVIADIDESVCELFNVSPKDTKFFASLGISGLRLDVKFDANEVAELSLNPEKLEVEINASDFSGLETEIMEFKHDKSIFTASHNFFPQKHTALSIKKFEAANDQMENAGFKVSAFVTINNRNGLVGAWDDSEGTPTVEVTRFMELKDQIQFLMAASRVDYIIVSNMFMTEQDFIDASNLAVDTLEFNINYDDKATDVEKNIVEFDGHKLRGDNPDDIMFRSTISRKNFVDTPVPVRKHTKEFFLPGDVIVVNDILGRYKGEVHIIKSKILNEGNKNFVGRILETQVPLLDLSRALLKFKIKEI